MNGDLLALAVPPLAPGTTFPIPELPPPLSPAGAAVMLLLAGAAVAGSLLPPEKPRKPHQGRERDAEDNKKVVKMVDVSKTIDDIVKGSLIGKLLLKDLIVTFTTAFPVGAGDWHEAGEISAEMSERIFGDLKDQLKDEIRKKLLQQLNVRRRVKKNVETRKP